MCLYLSLVRCSKEMFKVNKPMAESLPTLAPPRSLNFSTFACTPSGQLVILYEQIKSIVIIIFIYLQAVRDEGSVARRVP